MKILELIAKLTLKTDSFKASFREAKSEARKSSKEMAKEVKNELAKMFGAAAVIEGSKKLIERAAKILDISNKIGVSKKSLQEFAYGAEKAGGSIDDVALAFKGLADSREEALSGKNAEKLSLFDALGIKEDELRRNPLEETFRKIGESIRTMDFGQSEEPMLEKLLGGRGALNLIPAFKEGLAGAADEANRLGIIMKDDVVESLDKMQDTILQLTRQLQGPMAQALLGVATIFNGIIHAFQKGIVAPFVQLEAAAAYWQNEKAAGRDPNLSGAMNAGAEAKKAYLEEVEFRPEKEGPRTKKGSPFTESQSAVLTEAGKVESLRRQLFELNLKDLSVEERKKEVAERLLSLRKEMAELMEKQAKEGSGGTVKESDILTKELEIRRLEEEQKSKEKAMFKVGDVQSRGQLTGGTLARASYYDAIGMAATANISREQLSEARKQTTEQKAQNAKLEEIKNRMASGFF